MTPSSRPLLAALACLLLLPTGVHAQEGGSRGRKVQSFLIPYDAESVSMATRIGGLFEQSLGRQNRMELAELASALGGQPTQELALAREQARIHLDNGIRNFNEIQFGEAVRALDQALEIHRSHAAWIDRIPEYEEALAYLAAASVLMGNAERGRAAFKEILLFNSEFRIDDEKFDGSLQEIVDEVKKEIESGPVGSISVASQPAGARVFVSGVDRGFTPLTIDRIPTGRHILRLEQLGTMPHGEVVEITPTEDGNVQATLQPTEEFQRLQAVVTEVGQELGTGRVGPAMIRLGRYVGLDWALYGIVQRTFGSVQVTAWIVHIPEERRLASRRVEFAASDFGLEGEVEQFMRALLEDAWRREERGRGSDDPLSGRSGTEGWFRDRDGAGQRRSLDASEQDGRRGRRGRRGSDPLDERDGTEGW
jgi:hypothetical protein